MKNENIFEEYKKAAANIAEVKLEKDKLIAIFKNGTSEDHFLEDLKKVAILTTDQGPIKDDVFWLFHFKNVIVIPQGCPGEEKIIENIQKLPSFNNEQVIKAMSCSENKTFLVWELKK